LRASVAFLAAALAVSAACGGGGSHGAENQQTNSAGTSAGGTSTTTQNAGVMDAAAASDASASTSAAGGDAGFIAPTGPQAQQVAQAFSEGSAAYQHGDLAAAARAFERAYQAWPAPPMAYNLARAYERMGEVDQAVHYFDIVLHASPSPEQQADIERRIAGLRAYEARRREGIAQSLPSTDALSQEGNTWFQRGVTLYRQHHYQNALMAFEQAYQYLQTPELFYNLAVTHRALHNIDRALEFMREYLDARRGTPEEAWIEQQVHALEAQR
jgi:tetratricopeptide (TPR) repeat protein